MDEPWKHHSKMWKKPRNKGPCVVLFHWYEIFAIVISILDMGDSFGDDENVLELNRGDTTLWMPMNFIL